MIARVHGSCRPFTGALSEAFGRTLAPEEDLTGYTIPAHSSLPAAGGGPSRWASRVVAEYLAAPSRERAQGSQAEHPFVFHLSVRLHPDDRLLTREEWSEIARRLARAAGIAPPGDKQACRWIALRPQPGRLHLLASLIREDGRRSRQPRPLHEHLLSECRRIESDLRLHTAGASADDPQSVRESGVACAAQAGLLRRLTEDINGPLANVRRLVEQAAYEVVGLPDGRGLDAGQRLEWAARRLFALQQDLHDTAASLDEAAQHLPADPQVPAATPTAPVRRSR